MFLNRVRWLEVWGDIALLCQPFTSVEKANNLFETFACEQKFQQEEMKRERESRLPRNHVTLLMVVAVETFVVKFSVISQTLSVFLPFQRSLWRYLKLDFIPELPTAELMMLMRFFNSRGSHWKNEGILKTLQSFSPPRFSLILSKKTFN